MNANEVAIYFGIIVPLGIIALVFAFEQLRQMRKQDKKERDKAEERRYMIECDFSPSECAESHLPGDCPLCGAQ